MKRLMTLLPGETKFSFRSSSTRHLFRLLMVVALMLSYIALIRIIPMIIFAIFIETEITLYPQKVSKIIPVPLILKDLLHKTVANTLFVIRTRVKGKKIWLLQCSKQKNITLHGKKYVILMKRRKYWK